MNVPNDAPFDFVTSAGERWLTDFLTIGRRFRIRQRSYDPRAVSYLHQHFADLEPVEAAIRDFANRWGNLRAPTYGAGRSLKIRGRKGAFFGVSLIDWTSQIAAVRGALDGTLKNATTIINANLRDETTAALLPNPDRTGRAIFIVPRSLIGSIWLQTAQTLAGDHEHRKCQAPRCDNWFTVDPHRRGNAQRQRYCSVNCARRAQRAEKRKGTRP